MTLASWMRQPRGQRRDLVGLVALVPGQRAGERVQRRALAVLARPLRDVVVLQRGREFRNTWVVSSRHFEILLGQARAENSRDRAAVRQKSTAIRKRWQSLGLVSRPSAPLRARARNQSSSGEQVPMICCAIVRWVPGLVPLAALAPLARDTR